MKISVCFFLTMNFILFAQQNLPAPYNQLKTLHPFEMPWKSGPPAEKFSDFEQAPFLEKILKNLDAKVVIELGSHWGGSAIYIAQCLPEEGKLYSVDHWDAPPDLWDLPPYNRGIPSPHVGYYTKFLSNIVHAGVADKVIPLRMSTREAVTFFIENKIAPDLIYVDASHDEVSVYEDIQTYFPLIKEHGIMCGDDWDFPEKTVEKAVRRFAEENHLNIWVSPTNGRLWILYQPSAKLLI
jgi:predicted O-methyltransferase YrrM